MRRITIFNPASNPASNRATVTAIISATVLVALAGCNSDNGTPGSTATTAVTATTTVTGDHAESYYRNDLLLVPKDPDRNVRELPTSISRRLEGPLGVGALAEVVGLANSDDEIGALGRLLDGETDVVDGNTGLSAYLLTSGEDPQQLADELNDIDVTFAASPVLLTTIAGHWTFAPGSDPMPSSLEPVGPTSFSVTNTVAVIDTGYSDRGMPGWLAERVDPLGPADAEDPSLATRVSGHGSMVASLIALKSPGTRIVVAGMQPVDPGRFLAAPAAASNGFVTDEFRLYVAVDRLLRADYDYAALNLSLGTYQNGRTASGVVVAAAMQRWINESGTPIIAAAGNHDPCGEAPHVPFIPAALANTSVSGAAARYASISSVGSEDSDGLASDFSNPGMLAALGRDVVGVGAGGKIVSWSGSSFATALVTGVVASTGSLPTSFVKAEPEVLTDPQVQAACN